MKFILGRKIEMIQRFSEDGTVIPVTKIQIDSCRITQIKTVEKDGYNSLQIGCGYKKKLNKPAKGHLKDLPQFSHLEEFRIENVKNVKTGQVLDLSSFEIGQKVKATGTSKGRGFQGVVKRHGFHGSPATHGHKDQLRMPGSIGATDAARVFKGTRMGGHMGAEQVTVVNLEIAEIDLENNVLFIKGAVPGARNGLIVVTGKGEMKFKDEQQAEKIEEKIGDALNASSE